MLHVRWTPAFAGVTPVFDWENFGLPRREGRRKVLLRRLALERVERHQHAMRDALRRRRVLAGDERTSGHLKV